MFNTLKSRLAVIAFTMVIAAGQLYTNYRDTGSALKLGLDLQGGMHLVVEVDDPDGPLHDEAKSDGVDRVERILRSR
ncbi:MAG: hypothetical protein OEZ37_12455, partial [Gemmatimonadota bacterium]|nr:hypothetical protein [Gemmatimonadota bacterium]